jgi:hypothetical protein
MLFLSVKIASNANSVEKRDTDYCQTTAAVSAAHYSSFPSVQRTKRSRPSRRKLSAAAALLSALVLTLSCGSCFASLPTSSAAAAAASPRNMWMRLHSSIRSYSAYHSNNKRTPLSFLAGCSLHNNANHINSITSPRIHLSGRRSVVAFHSTVVPIDNKSSPSSDDDSPDTSTTTTGSHQKLPQWKDMGRGGDSSRSYTKYEQLVRRLYMTNLFHPVKLGLQNINRLHELLGCPMDNVSICSSCITAQLMIEGSNILICSLTTRPFFLILYIQNINSPCCRASSL